MRFVNSGERAEAVIALALSLVGVISPLPLAHLVEITRTIVSITRPVDNLLAGLADFTVSLAASVVFADRLGGVTLVASY